MTVALYARRKGWPLDEVTVRLRHSRVHAADCDHCETKEGRIDRLEWSFQFSGVLSAEQRTSCWRSLRCVPSIELSARRSTSARPFSLRTTPPGRRPLRADDPQRRPPWIGHRPAVVCSRGGITGGLQAARRGRRVVDRRHHELPFKQPGLVGRCGGTE